MKKTKKILATLIALAISAGCMAGCGGVKKTAGIGTNISDEAKQAIKDGKIVVSIPKWPSKDASNYEQMEETRREFMEQNPDIYIEGSQFNFDFKTFTAIAAADELPTMYNTYYTQVDSIIDDGFAAEITDSLDEYGFSEYINEDLLPYTSDDYGKIYALTYKAYNQGLYINKEIFKKAGLVDEAGNVLIPSSYEDVLNFSKTIKEKTGVAGFVHPTADNAGGWQFINVAWSHGVEFLEKTEDGKYTAAFDTEACYDAFEWIREMKKAELFPTSTTTVNQNKLYELFGTGQAAMMIANPPCGSLTQSYKMDPKNILVARMPEGPSGRYSQMGGDVYMFRQDATPEQIKACFKWLEFTGVSPIITEERAKQIEETNQTTIDNNGLVLSQEAFKVWSNPERDEKIREIYAKHTNVNPEDYASYFEGEDVIIRPEPEVACQELYVILDGVIQAIFANTDADIPALVKDAAHKWQVNYLDKLR